jgi:hypothetical protein
MQGSSSFASLRSCSFNYSDANGFSKIRLSWCSSAKSHVHVLIQSSNSFHSSRTSIFACSWHSRKSHITFETPATSAWSACDSGCKRYAIHSISCSPELRPIISACCACIISANTAKRSWRYSAKDPYKSRVMALTPLVPERYLMGIRLLCCSFCSFQIAYCLLPYAMLRANYLEMLETLRAS